MFAPTGNTALATIVLTAATAVSGPADAGNVGKALQQFERDVERLRLESSISGLSIAVLKDQRVVFAKGFGFADIENQVPAKADTPYDIASLTKPFAAAVLMKLVEKGTLDLDDAIADILQDSDLPLGPRGTEIHGYERACKRIRELGQDDSSPLAFLFQDYRCDKARITVRHHLTHTAQGVPGQAYRYNGFLYGLLTYVAEKISRKTFGEILVGDIIRPLGMADTVPSANEVLRDKVLARRAKYYRLGKGGRFVRSKWPSAKWRKAIERSGLDPTPKLNAASGVISTVLDLAKFDVAMDRNQIVSEQAKAAMFTPAISNDGQALPYGLGWFVQKHMGAKIIWHYGWAPDAYSSLFLKIPTEQLTMILLANSDGASASFGLSAGDVLNSPFAASFVGIFLMEAAQRNGPRTGTN